MKYDEEEQSNSSKSLDEFNESGNEIIFPVIEEVIKVTKKVVETGRVNITKTVNEKIEIIELPLLEEKIVIERIPKNELVFTMPAALRYEGNVMIIPVLKEVAVVEKRTMLVEEIRISTLRTEKIETHDVTVRKEEVNVTRTTL